MYKNTMNCKNCNVELADSRRSYCKECLSLKPEAKCKICNCKISLKNTYNYLRKKSKGFTCKSCLMIGDKNPSYGKKWDDDKKNRQSEIVKSKVDDEYRKKVSKGMKGKKVSDETKNKKRETERIKKENGYVRKPVSDEVRKKIGETSKIRMNDIDNKKKMRKSLELKNIWIPLDEKNDYHFYRNLSDWIGGCSYP
jgi:hypothetical protein